LIFFLPPFFTEQVRERFEFFVVAVFEQEMLLGGTTVWTRVTKSNPTAPADW
jgi:hypothetical protein